MSQVTITLSALLNSNFSTVFGKAKNYIKQFKDSINSSMFATLGAAQMAGKAIGYVSGTLQQVMQEAKQFEKTGIKFGVNPSEVAKLGKMAEETMTPVRSLYKGLNQLKAGAAEALANPKGDLADAFTQLGVSATQLEAGIRNPTELLGVLSDKLNGISDDGERQQAVMEIFKANGFALAGVLEMTSEQQRELLEGHTTMSDAVIGQNAAMEDTFGRFWDVVKNAFAMLGLIFNPLIQILSILINLISLVTKALVGGVFAALQVVGGALITVVGAVGMLIGGFLALGGLVAKVLGFGDGAMDFAKSWLNASKAITEGGISGGLAGAKSTMDATNRGMREDVDDIKRSGRAMAAGYGDDPKKKREGDLKFKSAERKKEEKEAVEAAKKKREEEEREAKIQQAKDKQKYDEINHARELLRLRRSMVDAGADEHDIKKAELQLELERQRKVATSTSGTESAEAFLEIDKIRAKMHDLELKRIEDRKKKEIEARREIAKSGLTFMETVEELGVKMKEEGMRRAGKSEGEIKKAQFADELDKAEKMRKEYDAAVKAAGGKDTAETIKMRTELVSQEGKVVGLAREGQQSNLGVMADAMRRIGGGGTAISTGNNSALELSKKQLDKVTSMEENIRKLVELVGRSGLATTQTGREMQVEAMALGSDNKPSK